jgi:hypothetical protein
MWPRRIPPSRAHAFGGLRPSRGVINREADGIRPHTHARAAGACRQAVAEGPSAGPVRRGPTRQAASLAQHKTAGPAPGPFLWRLLVHLSRPSRPHCLPPNCQSPTNDHAGRRPRVGRTRHTRPTSGGAARRAAHHVGICDDEAPVDVQDKGAAV